MTDRITTSGAIAPATNDSSPAPKRGTFADLGFKPFPGNSRTHSNKQVRQIAKSISRFGWMIPILIDAEGIVIAGHGRLESAKQLGLSAVPAIRIDHLTEAECRAYRLADNKIADNAGWDTDLLRIELIEIGESDVSLDLELTGFDTGEIDILLGTCTPPEPEAIPEPDQA